ncbi:MAG: proton-conducting transporter membrane subunit, partial [Candidatus Micrarchaeaceae archaeon]
VKRMFAYSAISQAGYITIGLAVGTGFGIEASIFQIFAHTFMIIGAFAIVSALEAKEVRSYREYSGLFYRNRFAAIALTLIMLSMAGLPPLIGFDGKLFLFSAAVESNMIYLALVGIINSLISIYYYARLINFMFTEKDGRKIHLGFGASAVAYIAVFIVVAIGIYPSIILHYAALASVL